MKPNVLFLLLYFFLSTAFSNVPESCEDCNSLSKSIYHRLRQIWAQGDNELYITGFAWHNRYVYPDERVQAYNENAWGGGLGKSFYDEKGDWHGLFAFAFLDSHKNLEPIAGYAFLKVLHFNDNTRLGGGITAFITARPDIFNHIPFPGVLPWISFSYRRATLSATYIPGAYGAGNVLFLTGKWLI